MEKRLNHQGGTPAMAQFERAFSGWVVKHRWWIIVATLVVVLATSSGIRFLTVSNNTRVYFSQDNPQLQALEALENTFSKDNSILYVVAPQDGNVFTREILQAVAELTETSWQMPYSSRVNSVTNFQQTRSEADDLIVEDLVGDISGLSDSDLVRIKRIALSEPLLVNRLVSPSGHVTGVNVTVLLPGESLQEVPEVATSI
jgi:predicted RND superfamily exporter protein